MYFLFVFYNFFLILKLYSAVRNSGGCIIRTTLENSNVQSYKSTLISIAAFQGFLCFSLFLSFYYVGSGDQTQKFGNKASILTELSYLI